MGLLDWLFGKKTQQPKTSAVSAASPVEEVTDNWEEVPIYLPNDDGENELVSVVATAIAAAEGPESQFKIKKILKKNPEAQLVTLIATSILAGDAPQTQIRVNKIYRKK